MTLTEAVQEAVTIVKEGRGDEFPPGFRHDCRRCPVAIFLSIKTGTQVKVGEFYIFGSDTAVDTPFELRRWIRQYDWGTIRPVTKFDEERRKVSTDEG